LKLRVYVPELNGTEAWQLAQKEGLNHVVKDSERFGHIWLEGYNGPMALSYFEPDRDVESPYRWYRWEKEARGWIGLAAKGWRVPNGERVCHVALLYVGEEAIREAHEKERRAEFNLRTGYLRVYPYGVPKPTKPAISSKTTTFTVAYLESLKTVEERFKALYRKTRRGYGGEEEEVESAYEFEMWGGKGWADTQHIAAILPKSNLPAFKEEMAKKGINYVETLTLADLQRLALELEPWQRHAGDEVYVYKTDTYGFYCETIDTALRAWHPRFLRDKYAPSIRVHWPMKNGPLVLFTDDQDWYLVAAPYTIREEDEAAADEEEDDGEE